MGIPARQSWDPPEGSAEFCARVVQQTARGKSEIRSTKARDKHEIRNPNVPNAPVQRRVLCGNVGIAASVFVIRVLGRPDFDIRICR